MSFDIQTQLNKLHRPVRWTAQSMSATPGLWGWIDNNGMINPVVDTPFPALQPQVLKPIFGAVGSSGYITHDSRVSRRIATVEGIFRVECDSDCYQVYDCQTIPVAITYTKGMELTVACRVGTATADPCVSAAADLGKLKPAQPGDVVVAVYEGMNFNRFCYATVSPHLYGGVDPYPRQYGSGAIAMSQILETGTGSVDSDRNGIGGPVIGVLSIDSGSGSDVSFLNGAGDAELFAVAVDGSGSDVSFLSGTGDAEVFAVIGDGVGDKTP